MSAARKKRHRPAPARFDDLSEKVRNMPLAEVVRGIAEGQREVDRLDDAIGRQLAAAERAIRERRPTGYPVDVPFPPWGKLAWSGRRGRWRLVVLEDEDTCTDLFNMPALCRADACHVLDKLVRKMGLIL